MSFKKCGSQIYQIYTYIGLLEEFFTVVYSSQSKICVCNIDHTAEYGSCLFHKYQTWKLCCYSKFCTANTKLIFNIFHSIGTTLL